MDGKAFLPDVQLITAHIGGDAAAEFFKDNPDDSYLIADGFAGYNKLKRFRRCCCYAHLRRYFIEAIPKGHEKDFTDPGVQGMLYCNKIFEWGDEIGYSVIQQMELMPAWQITHSKYSRRKNCNPKKITDCSFFQYTILFSAYDDWMDDIRVSPN